MRRLHVIEDFDRMGGEVYFRERDFEHDPELLKAYHCGVKDGWKEAMEEVERGGYHERRDWREMPPMYRGNGSRGGVSYREDDREWDDYSERRRRDSRGRYM